MMLAYQPVRSLATVNIAIQQGLAGAKSVLPIIDYIPEIKDNSTQNILKETILKIQYNKSIDIFNWRYKVS